MGGFPDGWEPPFLTTACPYEAIKAYEAANPGHMQTVAIFDANGEGEPLDPERVEEILDAEYDRTHVRL
jgi:hypothetical protein